MTFYQQLLAVSEPDRARLLATPIIQAGGRGEATLEQYLAFLTEAYHHVKHTVPLLMACGARLPERLGWLRDAVAHYIEEERGHEEWILNDIRNAGGDAEAVRRGQPARATELMVAYAYDTIQRGNPVGLFGMVLVLEGTSVALALHAADAIRDRLGLGGDCFSYLTSHGELDREHVGFFEQLMNRLDDPADQAAVIHCTQVVYQLYGDIFRGLPAAEATEAAA